MHTPNPNEIKRTGSLWFYRKKKVSTAGETQYELARWRCADCGISLFKWDGTCVTCGCKVRIPRQKGQ